MKREKGFTLIELLIVVAIIGILAALLIPNIMTAMQKAKQKGTMKDVSTIATALTDYMTDHGVAPEGQSGPYTSGDAFYVKLSPFYIKILPVTDQWGNSYEVYTGTAVSGKWGISYASSGEDPGQVGGDEFAVGSNGRNGIAGDVNYDPSNPNDSLYAVSSMADFDKELVIWNGSWIICPQSRGGGTSAVEGT